MKFLRSLLPAAGLLSLLFAMSPSLNAQCGCTVATPAAPAEPTFGLSGAPNSSTSTPTYIIFTVTTADTTPGAWLYYTVTTSGGTIASGSIPAASTTVDASGTFTFSAPISQLDSGTVYTIKIYAQIPAGSNSCPAASPESAVYTATVG